MQDSSRIDRSWISKTFLKEKCVNHYALLRLLKLGFGAKLFKLMNSTLEMDQNDVNVLSRLNECTASPLLS